MTPGLLPPETLSAVMEATWPAAGVTPCGPFLLRDGQGGGKRVSAATAETRWTAEDIDRAEAAMNGRALFLIREADTALDHELAQRGYGLLDPVVAYSAPVNVVAGEGPARMTSFPHWPPMEIAKSLWAEGGIGAGRLAVMDRATGPKTCILGRANDRASGVAFVACHGRHAMLHALEVTPALRRQGSAQNIMRAAAAWASSAGADTLSLVVTKANDPARALYTALGMSVMGQYHYRQK